MLHKHNEESVLVELKLSRYRHLHPPPPLPPPLFPIPPHFFLVVERPSFLYHLLAISDLTARHGSVHWDTRKL